MTSKHFLLAVSMVALVVPAVTRADDDDDDEASEHERRPGRGHGATSAEVFQATPAGKKYAAECGSCHLAFPPSMLPSRSWKALLAGLNDHFGQNAELDLASRRQLEEFFLANAGADAAGPAPLRITEQGWWRREHRELNPAVFHRKAILTPANCGACHPGANQGAFGEHQVQVPLDAPAAR